MKGVIMSFWLLSVSYGNLWVLLTNAAVRNEAVTTRIAETGMSETAFLMFFFALFAFIAAAAFAWYARRYPLQDHYRSCTTPRTTPHGGSPFRYTCRPPTTTHYHPAPARASDSTT